MSFTITICPRCEKDFMYHWSDTHLSRNNKVVLCQNCDEKEMHLLRNLQNNLRLRIHGIMKDKGISFTHSVEQCKKYPETYEFITNNTDLKLSTIAAIQSELREPLLQVLLP